MGGNTLERNRLQEANTIKFSILFVHIIVFLLYTQCMYVVADVMEVWQFGMTFGKNSIIYHYNLSGAETSISHGCWRLASLHG